MGWSSLLTTFLAGSCLLSLAYGQAEDCPGSTFRLFAYGKGVSGLPVFYADGQAQMGNMTLSNATEKTSIYFNIPEDSPRSWRALPNLTESPDARFESLVFNLPSISARSEGNVGFVDPDSRSRRDAKSLRLYGGFVLIDLKNANFFGTRAGTDGVYNLGWNTAEEASDNRVSLTLRTTPPSNEKVLAGGFNLPDEL